jgi:Pectate lyase superfamily protein
MMLKKPGERSVRRLKIAMRGCLPAIALALAVGAAVFPPAAFAQTRTTVADTIHAPDGGLPSGQIVISATSTFTAADGSVVLRGTVVTVTVTNGAFSVALIPNAGSTPLGTSYSAIYKLAGVPYRNETWVVPSSASPVTLAEVRAAVLSGPSQLVSSSQLPATLNTSGIEDKGGQVFNVKASYNGIPGAKGDGTTDDTAAVNSAIAAAIAVGGTVYFPPGTYLVAGALVVPNDGSTPPNQKPLRMTGALMDAGSIGTGKAPSGGAILNLTGTSNTVGKIDTRGQGYLEIDRLTLEDTAGDSIPFIHTTNTILHVHDDSFVGSKDGTACDQDAIILGGDTSVTDGSANAQFQGYGTVIADNWFNHIRRMVYGQVSANGVKITGNFDWVSSGSNLANGAAIEFDNTPASPAADAGNNISGNFIEFENYVYGVKLTQAVDNQITGNNFFDPGSGTLAAVDFTSTATFNVVHCGFSGGKACMADGSGKNTAFDTSGDGPTYIKLPWNFDESQGYVPLVSGSSSSEVYGMAVKSTATNDQFSWDLLPGSSPTAELNIEPAGGSPETELQFYRASSTTADFGVGTYSDTTTKIHSLAGDLRLYAGGSSGVTWIGGNSAQPTYFSNSLMHVGTEADFTGQIKQTAVSFASAAACNSGNEGSVQAIADSTVSTWGSTIAGGGSKHVLGYCDGTNWTVAAK